MKVLMTLDELNVGCQFQTFALLLLPGFSLGHVQIFILNEDTLKEIRCY